MAANFEWHFDGVSFDMDGTLYALDHFKVHLALRRPLDLRHWILMEKVRKKVRRERLQDDDIGARVVERMASKLGRPVDEVAARVTRMIDEDWPALLRVVKPYRRLRPFLEALASAGVPMVVNSDYPGERKLEALGLSDLPWAGVLDATACGALKPRPEVYLAACEALGVPPRRVLHVGDSPELDVAGAAAVGMMTALVGRHRPDPAVPEQRPDFVFQSTNRFCDAALVALSGRGPA